MDKYHVLNEELCKRLPLPLAQLYERAHSAKSEMERHHIAYYLWEAGIKLMASAVVLRYAMQSPQQQEHAVLLQRLVKPQTSHWCEILRALLPITARGDAFLNRNHKMLAGKLGADLSHCSQLDMALRTEANGVDGPDGTLLHLFERVAGYREAVFAPDLFAGGSNRMYRYMGDLLLSAAGEWLPRIDVLAGRQLAFINNVTTEDTDRTRVDRIELTGTHPLMARPWEFSGSPSRLPRAGTLCVHPAATPRSDDETVRQLQSLHPLVLFDAEADHVFFRGSTANGDQPEYLCYTTGQTLDPDPLGEDFNDLMKQLLRIPIDVKSDAWSNRIENGKSPRDTTLQGQGRENHRLGEFNLLTRMGRGGIGKVFRAWQPSLGKQVAIKCLSKSENPGAVARCASEILALARVEHPNLVRVFASGDEEDHWYFAMELVDGVELGAVGERFCSDGVEPAMIDHKAWNDKFRQTLREARLTERPLDDEFDVTQLLDRSPSADTRSASHATLDYVRHIVRLLLPVVRAAESLHESGVVHGEIHPGNVMVTSDGQSAVLMDPGMPRMKQVGSEAAPPNRTSLETLRYASPEQVLSAGAVDHRSDIYGLGATLWESLTLRPLFASCDETDPLETMRCIEYEDPESIRDLNPRVPKDLAAIINKCLEKAPHRRYQSVAELGDELSRFLNYEPVFARPLGSLSRSMRGILRHPVGSTLALVTVLSIVTLGALFLNRRNLARTKQDRYQLELANQRADEDFERAVTALDGVFELLTEGNLKRRADLEPLRQQLLDYYADQVSHHEETRHVSESLGQVHQRIARIMVSMGNNDADDHFDAALEIYEQMSRGGSDSRSLAAAAGTIRIERGLALMGQRDYDNAEKDFAAARDTFAELSESNPGNLDYWQQLAEAHHNLGRIGESRGNRNDSLDAYQESLEIRRDKLIAKSDNPRYLGDYARSHASIGNLQLKQGDYAGALRSYEESVALRKEIVDVDPTDHGARLQLSRSYRALGQLRQLQSGLANAIQLYEHAVAEARRLVDEEPLINDYRADLARFSNELVELLLDESDRTGDTELSRKAQRHVEETAYLHAEIALRNPEDAAAIASLAQSHLNTARLLADQPQLALSELDESRLLFARIEQPSAMDLFQMGVIEALTAELRQQSEPGGETDIQPYVDAAVELLSRAVKSNRYTTLPRIQRCRVLDDIRNRPGFRDLVATQPRGAERRAVDARQVDSLYALAVGVSDYVDPKLDLSYPDDDARSLSEVYRAQKSVFDRKINVHQLIDEKATRRNILNTINEMRTAAQSDGPCLFVISLSGHGRLHEGGDYYFLPHDFEDDAAITATGVSWDDLLKEFELIPGVVIVVLDTCHSGAVDAPMRRQMELAVAHFTERVERTTSRGVAVLASSLSGEASREKPQWGHGALSLAILEALNGEHLFHETTKTAIPQISDENTITLYQLIDYAVRRVDELTDRRQHVAVRHPNMSPLDITLGVAD